MAIEIERKFLVKDDSWRPSTIRQRKLQQGYLTRDHDPAVVRVRIEGSEHAWITIKSGGTGMARDEYEYEIPVRDAQELLTLCGDYVLAKTRHLVPVDGLTWEVDVFEGRHQGLVIAEVELPSTGHQPSIPSWAGEEVTGQPEYGNASLARPDCERR